MGRAQRNGPDVGGVNDCVPSLDQRDVVGQCVGVVARVVHNSRCRVVNSWVSSAGSTLESSKDNECIASIAINRAVSSRDNPSVVMDPASAEMEVSSCAQRGLVRELAGQSVGTSDNTTLPLAENVTSRNSCRLHRIWD